jgi:hypothetical protein
MIDFDLYEEDLLVIMSAMVVLRKMLQRVSTVDQRVGAVAQVVGIAHALHALERLPVATPGVHVKLSINLCANDDDRGTGRYVSMTSPWRYPQAVPLISARAMIIGPTSISVQKWAVTATLREISSLGKISLWRRWIGAMQQLR